MGEGIQGIFVHPPIATARLGASPTPLDAFEWIETDDPRPRNVGLVESLEVIDVLGLRWLTEGFVAETAVGDEPVAAGLQRSRSRVEPTLLAIGDASFARDPLSSQGMLSAMVDACHAIASLDDADAWPSKVRGRAEEQWQRHRSHLAAMVNGSRFSGEKAWREYAAWLGTGGTA